MSAINTSIAAVMFCLLGAMTGRSALAQDSPVYGVFVNEAQSNDVIGKAIETVVAKMNFIKRPIARGRLKKTNPLYQHIEISRNASTIEVRFDAGKPVLLPQDGSVARWTRDDGEQFDVTGKLQGETLVQTFAAEDGQRVNTFSVGADGKLMLQVTLTSPQLPEPVRYQLAYRREAR
jgi:hypothetical protein